MRAFSPGSTWGVRFGVLQIAFAFRAHCSIAEWVVISRALGSDLLQIGQGPGVHFEVVSVMAIFQQLSRNVEIENLFEQRDERVRREII